jgi:hypothetical protein
VLLIEYDEGQRRLKLAAEVRAEAVHEAAG